LDKFKGGIILSIPLPVIILTLLFFSTIGAYLGFTKTLSRLEKKDKQDKNTRLPK